MINSEAFSEFEMDEFDFEGTTAVVVKPNIKPINRIAFKTEYWGDFPELEVELLKRGFHLVHVLNHTRLANRADIDRKVRFIDYVSEKYNLDKRCVLVGMSCGGAQAVNFAGYYPEYASVLVIDAPVLNFLDFPGRYDRFEEEFEEEFTVAYPGVKRSDIFKLDENPINRVKTLIEKRLPVIMLYGTQDETVQYPLNGRLLEEAYSENKDLLTVIQRLFQGHHPHGLLGKSNELADLVMSKLI